MVHKIEKMKTKTFKFLFHVGWKENVFFYYADV